MEMVSVLGIFKASKDSLNLFSENLTTDLVSYAVEVDIIEKETTIIGNTFLPK